MKIALTGSTGFVGKNLLSKLSNYDVVCHTRKPINTNDKLFELEKSDQIDLSDSPDVLIHCAAYLPPSYQNCDEAEKCLINNGIATLKLLQAADKAKIKTFIYLSSGQIYGWKTNNYQEALETDNIDPIYRAQPYLTSKMVGDCYIRTYKGSMRTIILRPSSVYGIGMQKKGLIHNLKKSILLDEFIKVEGYNIDLVNVNCISNFIINSIENTKISGAYNVGGGEAILTYFLAGKIAEILNKRAKFKEGIDLSSNGHPALCIDRAKSVGYKPISLDDGLKEYLEHLMVLND